MPTQPTPDNAQRHTPTPWRLEVTQATAWIGTPKGETKLNYIVCGIPAERDLKPEARDLALGNAAFIVRACNSHDALVAALEKFSIFTERQAERLRSKAMPAHSDYISKDGAAANLERIVAEARAALSAAQREGAR